MKKFILITIFYDDIYYLKVTSTVKEQYMKKFIFEFRFFISDKLQEIKSKNI